MRMLFSILFGRWQQRCGVSLSVLQQFVKLITLPSKSAKYCEHYACVSVLCVSVCLSASIIRLLLRSGFLTGPVSTNGR